MEGRSRIKPFFVAKAGCVAQLDSLQNCRTSLGCMFTHRVIIISSAMNATSPSKKRSSEYCYDIVE